MTELLKTAIEKVSNLSPSEQDAIAAIIIEELEDERRWDESFARSQDKLSRLEAKVREEIAAGRVHKVGIDEL